MRRVVTPLITILTVVLLVGAILWAANARWHIFEKPQRQPTPSPHIQATGEWRGAPEVIGAMFLAVCNGYTEPFTALRPTPPGLVRAIADAWPDEPKDENYLAVSDALYIPRNNSNVAKDIDAWLQQNGARPDCNQNPWTEEEAESVRKASGIALFGVARPVVRNSENLWELAFAVVRWTDTRR